MINPKLLKESAETTLRRLKTKGYTLDYKKFNDLEKKRKNIRLELQLLQSKRNKVSKKIGVLKSERKKVTSLISEMSNLNNELKEKEILLREIQQLINNIIFNIPNIPYHDVPVGNNSSENVEIRRWSSPKKFSFVIQDHVSIGKNIGNMSFSLAAKISGSRFVILSEEIAKLQRSLIQFMIDLHSKEHDYTELYVPYLVNEESLFGTGQLPKFSEEIFTVNNHNSLGLIPTAEVPITNILSKKTIDLNDLPLKFVSHTPCFRSEAGSYGKDTRGLIRQHQFEKVEMVQIVEPKNGLESLETLTKHAETVLRRLNIPYRVIHLCTGDTGFSACKTYDLEVWMPFQRKFREVSSCSWCGDFQARRIKAKFKSKDMKKSDFVHTLNGSGLAVGRTLAAIIENYQTKDGGIIIPQVLQEYMNLDKIEPKKSFSISNLE